MAGERGEDAAGERPRLSVVVTPTDGGAVEKCLAALARQRGAPATERIVPVDAALARADAWRRTHPEVRFVEVPGVLPSADALRDPGVAHELHDRRRAAGLAAARGGIVALIEEHVRVPDDWCARVLAAHAGEAAAAVGGAIENVVDRPLAWALYFCDFGRYQPPLPPGPTTCVSSRNVAYARPALEAAARHWRDGYDESALHEALAGRGGLRFDPALRVALERETPPLRALLRERCAGGRLYAARRARTLAAARRRLHALASPLLPALLLARHARTARARGRQWRAFVRALPWTLLLLTAWSAGECTGYVTGRATSPARAPD